MAMITSILTLIFFFFSSVLSLPTIENLPVSSLRPHNFAFDSLGRGPYTSVGDGHILFYQNSRNRFVDFAYTSPNRMRALCDGIKTFNLLSICGRPLSMAFFHRTRQLFVVDVTLGLFVVGRNGWRAKQLASRLVASLLASHKAASILSKQDSTGRLLKYDRRTKRVSVLLNNIPGAAGVAVSKDGTYLLITEFAGFRVQKYWLRGPKANTTEVILQVTSGIPDNIRTENEHFWIAVTSLTGQLLRVRINDSGTILETLTFSPKFKAPTIAKVIQYKDKIYLGSLLGASVGVYTT